MLARLRPLPRRLRTYLLVVPRINTPSVAYIQEHKVGQSIALTPTVKAEKSVVPGILPSMRSKQAILGISFYCRLSLIWLGCSGEDVWVLRTKSLIMHVRAVYHATGGLTTVERLSPGTQPSSPARLMTMCYIYPLFTQLIMRICLLCLCSYGSIILSQLWPLFPSDATLSELLGIMRVVLSSRARAKSITSLVSRKMSLNYALDILMYSCRFCS